MEIKIIQITPDRWEEYKDLRLASLRENPIAFDSSAEEEENFSEDVWREMIEGGYRVFAEAEGKLVGKMEAEWRNEHKLRHIGELYGVFIDAEYRGKGIGERLWVEIERLASGHELKKFWLDVVTTQSAAMKLYPKLGFREVGLMKNATKVNGVYYDKLLMEKIF